MNVDFDNKDDEVIEEPTYEEKIERLNRQGIEILTMDDCINDMKFDLENGKEKSTSTFVDGIDDCWTWRMGEFNIWTGYSNEGKSQFLRFLSLVKALEEEKLGNDWRFAFYAPEDYPAKEFFDDLIHTASGRSTDKDNTMFIGEERYLKTYERIKKFFYFNYIRPPKNSLVKVLKSFVPLIEEKNVKVCVVDPIIKVARPSKYLNADDKYAAYVTTLATDFTRAYNVSLHLVMHQVTPGFQENGLYPKPSMYRIKGGGTWADGTDNILSIQRPLYAKDKIDNEVIFTSQKIKKQKLVGIPQDLQLRFDRKTNRYINFNDGKDLYNFDKLQKNPTMRVDF